MKIEIKNAISEIIILLYQNNEVYWEDVFKRYLIDIDNDYEETLYNLRGLYGGMGSFNDLVLHKEEFPLEKENNELDILRKKLYRILK